MEYFKKPDGYKNNCTSQVKTIDKNDKSTFSQFVEYFVQALRLYL